MKQDLVSEILRRPFSATQRLVLLHVASLTIGRSMADVAIPSIEALARLVGSARPHVSGAVDDLVRGTVLGRDERAGTWYLHPVDLWAVQPDLELDAARALVILVDENRRREWWPQPAAADLVPEKLTSEILTAGAPGNLTRNTPEEIEAAGAAAGTNAPPALRATPLRAGRAGYAGATKRMGLDRHQWLLLRELLDWCAEVGETCTAKQEKNWGWRVWTQPLAIEAALQAARLHLAAGGPIRSRFGLVKHFWRLQERGRFEAPPRSAERLHGGTDALPAAGVHACEPAAGAAAAAAAAARPPAHAKARADVAGCCEQRAQPAGGDGDALGVGERTGGLKAAVLAQIAADREAER